MRTYTVGEAAALAGCHKGTVTRLKQKGVLEGSRGVVQAPNRQYLVEVVDKATRGRHGWKWRERGRRTLVTGHEWEGMPRIIPAKEVYGEESLAPTGVAVKALRQWVAFPPTRRELLLTLANRYTDEELRLLAEL